MSDQITIPALYVDTEDATLTVESDEYGDAYTMTLTAADGHVIASASGFRPAPAFGTFGDDRETAATFGSFLGAALEDSEFASEWETIADDASDWADALTIMGEEN